MLRVCSHSPEGSATAKQINQSVPAIQITVNETLESKTRPRRFSRPYIQLFDQFNSRIFSLTIKQTSLKFLTYLSEIHLPQFSRIKWDNTVSSTQLMSTIGSCNGCQLSRLSKTQRGVLFIITLRNIFLAKFNFEWSAQYDAANCLSVFLLFCSFHVFFVLFV